MKRWLRAPLGRRWSSAHILAVPAAAVLLLAGSGTAASFKVCPSGCPYATIQDALAAAADGDRITIAPGISAGGLAMDKSVNLVGSGADRTTISGGGTVVSVFRGISATIRGVTLSGGSSDGTAGGVYNDFGTVVLAEVVVSGNTTAVRGGGIGNGNTLAVERSVISDNTAVTGSGGGIQNNGTAAVLHSTVSGNSATGPGGGGGIANDAEGTLQLERSTVRGNAANAGGGSTTGERRR